MTPALLTACAACGVSPECFRAGYRQRDSMYPQVSRNRLDIADRAKVFRWLRERGHSLPEIASVTGLRSHTTVMYALMRAEGRPVRPGRVKVRIIPKKVPMKLETQRKVRAIMAETRQIAQQPADDSPGSILTIPESSETRTTTIARCPKCGLRQLTRTDIQDDKGRFRWECRRFDPVCGWVSFGR